MKILIVDDHVLIREAMRGVLKGLKEDAVVMEASDCRQAMQLIEKHPDFSLVLLDLSLPDRDGFAVLGDLRDRYPAISVVVLSAFHDHENVVRALKLGAQGFIPKSGLREVMVGALQLVFSGGIYIPPEILRHSEPAPKPHRPTPKFVSDIGLTERQIDVLTLMMQGKSNKLICRALQLAEPTVKNHVTAILKALQVTNRTEAVVVAAAIGLGQKHSQ
jgi:DNA-binding NarL/FixJ family response regulator